MTETGKPEAKKGNITSLGGFSEGRKAIIAFGGIVAWLTVQYAWGTLS